jgi:AcrR family transcriptional regulator
MELPVTRAGHPTRDKILRSSIDLVVDAGFANLTIAKVAERAGLAYGNLTYHFPTREHLVTEIFHFWAEHWRSDLITKIKNISTQQPLTPIALVNALLAAAINKRRARLSTELWAACNHDPKLGKRVREIVDELAGLMAASLGVDSKHPRASAIRSHLLALITLSQGVSAVWGGGSKGSTTEEEALRVACEGMTEGIERVLR